MIITQVGVRGIVWEDGGNTRGTYDIISLCVSTLLICVWSAVHIDVVTQRTFWHTYAKRLGWLVVGLVLPEMLVMTALAQLAIARDLAALGQRQLPSLHPPPDPAWKRVRWRLDVVVAFMKRKWNLIFVRTGTREVSASASAEDADAAHPTDPEPAAERLTSRVHPWTLSHGFYAAMGGFVFDTSPGQPFLPLPDSRVVITPSGIAYLMEHAPYLIPDISAEDVDDKSKSGAVVKALLCCQVIFFCCSCAARLDQRLPLSLLEITTLSHCLCALVAYALWWYKPQDVGEPTVISGESARQICALMYMSSNVERFYPLGVRKSSFWPAEMEYLTIIPYDDARAADDLSGANGKKQVPFVVGDGFVGFSPKSTGELSVLLFYGTSAIMSSLTSNFSPALMPWYMRQTLPHFMPPTRDLKWFLDERDASRLSLARQALRSHPMPHLASTSWCDRPPLVTPSQHLRSPLKRLPRLQLRLFPIAIALIYGLPHILGLSQAFPSQAEESAWRLASVAVVCTPIIAFQILWPRLSRDTWKFKIAAIGAIIPLFAYLFPVVYLISSGFLVYESIRQVFALPYGAFIEAQMTFYWPHFS